MTAPVLAPLLGLPGVADAAERAREGTDRLLRHRVLRRRSESVSAEAVLRSAWASAALAGYAGSLPDARAGDPTALLQRALRAHAELGRLAVTWRQAPMQALARLHVLISAADADPERIGRPVADASVADRLSALRRLVTEPAGVPAVVEAAVVHAEILAPQAFGPESGLVARAAARLVMITRGLDAKALTVPEIGHLEAAGEYAAALAGYATGAPDGVAAWLRHCCAALERGAQEGSAVCASLARG